MEQEREGKGWARKEGKERGEDLAINYVQAFPSNSILKLYDYKMNPLKNLSFSLQAFLHNGVIT